MTYRPMPHYRPLRECFDDCAAHETGDPADCECEQQNRDAYEREVDRRVDAALNGDDDEDDRRRWEDE